MDGLLRPSPRHWAASQRKVALEGDLLGSVTREGPRAVSCRFSVTTEAMQGSPQALFSACSTQSTIADVGIAPEVRAISCPFLIMIMLGMLRMP